MSSDRRCRLAALALLVVFPGCGKQGDPAPRPRPIPQPANELELRQRGFELLLEFPYPATTVAGLPLAGIASATIYEAVMPLAPEAELPKLDEADLEALALPVAVLAGTALDEAVVGSRIRAHLALPASAFERAEARVYAVRTEGPNGDRSPWSKAVALRPRTAPAAPVGLVVTAQKEGVALSWTSAADAVSYVVLRREAKSPDWSTPLATVPPETTTYLDRGALYGTRYVYTVLALAQLEPPIESAPVRASEVDYRDLYPPAPARELRALALSGDIRLVWDGSADADLAGYRVERAESGGAWHALTPTPILELEFADAAAPRGVVLQYRVLAIDRNGNAAKAAGPVEVRRR